MNDLVKETKEIMKKYGVVADKKFGQNFLIDYNAIEKIIYESNISKDDLIIEIGPGLGTLTKYLLEKAGKVICVELDRRMIEILKNRFDNVDNMQIINEDILKTDIKQIISENIQFKCVKVVANLPYYITTPIIMKLLEEKSKISSITIMVQKEVADRITALPNNKDYGILTLSIKYYAKATEIIQVPRTSFIPSPNVDSTVLNLNVYHDKVYNILDEKIFFNIVKGGFSQRRKMFVNSIESTMLKYGIPKEDFREILQKNNISENIRAENLSIDEYILITNDIYKKIKMGD